MELTAGQHEIATSASQLATILPFAVMQSLAEALTTCQFLDGPTDCRRVVQCLAHPHYRSLATDFLDAWRTNEPQLSAQAVAMALLSAAHVRKRTVGANLWNSSGPAPMAEAMRSGGRSRPSFKC